MSSHVLVIPSEEFVPARSPLAGIFQKQQLDALSGTGSERFGVLSVRLLYSLPMIAKSAIYRMIGRSAPNALGSTELGTLIRLARDRTFDPATAVTVERTGQIDVVRIDGLYMLPPSDKRDHRWWVRAGMAAFETYVGRFGRPDLVHAHNAIAGGLLAAAIRRRYGVPYVLTEHSSYYHQGKVPGCLHAPVRKAIADAARMLVVSGALARSLEQRLGPLPIQPEIIGNVLSPLFATPASRAPSDGRFSFLSVGNLLPVKGHATLLRAFASVAPQRPDATLRIAGDGPLRAELHAEAAALTIADRIEFLGEISHEQVRSEMLRADAFVFPSRYETFGVALAEAMACGLPVIATRAGGPEDMVTPLCGLLVEPDQPTALAAAMLDIAAHPARYDSEAIRNNAIANWGPEAFCARTRSVYAAALGDLR